MPWTVIKSIFLRSTVFFLRLMVFVGRLNLAKFEIAVLALVLASDNAAATRNDEIVEVKEVMILSGLLAVPPSTMNISRAAGTAQQSRSRLSDPALESLGAE